MENIARSFAQLLIWIFFRKGPKIEIPDTALTGRYHSGDQLDFRNLPELQNVSVLALVRVRGPLLNLEGRPFLDMLASRRERGLVTFLHGEGLDVRYKNDLRFLVEGVES